MTRKIASGVRERRIWYFPCSGCGRDHAQSHKKRNAVAARCRICRKTTAHPDQPSLFSDPIKELVPRGELIPINS